jgi:hypothetical protein|nr:MAG TPA: hypothetical protein [Caudoviricetes sp.]
MPDCNPTVIISALKKIIAFARKRQDTIQNTVFVAGSLVLVWAGIRVLTSFCAPCFGF